jgi:hypothetical protein
VDDRPGLDQVAIGRLSVSKPFVWKAFASYNAGRSYADQVKPSNFLLTAHVLPFGHPAGVDVGHFRLVIPYELRPSRRRRKWLNIYDGIEYAAQVGTPETSAAVAVLSTFRDVVEAYRYHEEAKSSGPDGTPGGKRAGGLLGRLSIVAPGEPRYVGKESNRLEEVEAGIVGDEEDVQTTYHDRAHEINVLRTVLQRLPKGQMAKVAGISTRRLQDIVHGRSTPRPRTLKALRQAARDELAERLEGEGCSLTRDVSFEPAAATWLQLGGSSVRASASRIRSDARVPSARESATIAERDGELAPRSTMPT